MTSKVVLKSKYNSTAFCLFSQGFIFKVFHMHSLLFIKRSKLIGAGVRDFCGKSECLEATSNCTNHKKNVDKLDFHRVVYILRGLMNSQQICWIRLGVLFLVEFTSVDTSNASICSESNDFKYCCRYAGSLMEGFNQSFSSSGFRMTGMRS